MRKRIGGIVAAAFLCVVAGTVGLWSGPLAAASGALHTGAASTSTSHASAVHTTR